MPDLDDTTRHSLNRTSDLSRERASSEAALNQRFNSFLVFFSVVVLAAVNARSRGHLLIVLSVSSLMSLGLALLLRRGHQELESIVTRILDDPAQPVTLMDGDSVASLRWITGWLLPFGCTLGLMVATAAAYQGSLTPAGSMEESEAKVREAVNQMELMGREMVTLRAALAQASMDAKTAPSPKADKVTSPAIPTKKAAPSVAPKRRATPPPVSVRRPAPRATPKRPPPRGKPTPTARRPSPTQ